MNINTSQHKPLQSVQATQQSNAKSVSSASVALGSKGQVDAEQVSLSKKAQITSQLSGLTGADKKQADAFIGSLNQQFADTGKIATNAMDNAPKSIKEMATKLNISAQDLTNLESKSITLKSAQGPAAQSIAAYAKVAGQK